MLKGYTGREAKRLLERTGHPLTEQLRTLGQRCWWQKLGIQLWQAGSGGAAAKAGNSMVLGCPMNSLAPVSGDRLYGGSRS
jgi:hypothetical protein